MAEQPTPRAMVKALLKGELPSRPLLMPTIFSLGSRLENLPLHDFQRNPTKIANALRQIRSVLKVDGLSCYYDPFLEAEALGCTIGWRPDGSAALVSSAYEGIDALRRKLPLPEEILQRGRIRVAPDVLHRLKTILHDNPALMVSVTGPLTLAGFLHGGSEEAGGELPPELVEFAAEVTAVVSQHFVESGADVVFIVESALPGKSPRSRQVWASLLDPIINVIRFYEALPVILAGDPSEARDDFWAILDHSCECVFCPVFAEGGAIPKEYHSRNLPFLGIALPTKFGWRTGGAAGTSAVRLNQVFREERPILLVSTSDVPIDSDLKQLKTLLESARNCLIPTG